MGSTPSPTNTWRILGGLNSIRDSLAAFVSNTLAPRSPPLPPSSPSPVLVRELSFGNGVDDKADENDNIGIRCGCAKKCHDLFPDSSFLKRRRAEFEHLDTKDRQFRCYIELHVVAGKPAPGTWQREVTTRYAIIASIINGVRCCGFEQNGDLY